jgi:acetyl-CoA carboxylase carboxyl transferase subunit beta
LWHQTPTGKIIEHEELKNNNFVSPEDGFHVRIGSREYLICFSMATSLKN